MLDSIAVVLALLAGATQAPKPPAPFKTPLTLAEMTAKQAVVDTSAGTFVIDLRPDLAPNHVGYFIELARSGAYDATIFHRVIKLGIIQGGDPLSKDPAKAKQYGTGGLGVLQAEIGNAKHTRGAVSAVLVPGKRDSAGSQFFVCVTDQPALDGKYSIFGQVSDGLDVVQKISEAPVDANGMPTDRVVIRSIAIRDTPPPEPEPFSTESVADLSRYRAILDTTAGPITLKFFPDKAPNHVRHFLRLGAAGVFDGTSFHRVVRGFVIQTGSLNTRPPLAQKQQKLVRSIGPEFNDTKHVKGILSMARGDDPASALTSFFIVTGEAPSLDGKYTVFGRVEGTLAAVEAIEQTPVKGEEPVNRIELRTVKIVKLHDVIKH